MVRRYIKEGYENYAHNWHNDERNSMRVRMREKFGYRGPEPVITNMSAYVRNKGRFARITDNKEEWDLDCGWNKVWW